MRHSKYINFSEPPHNHWIPQWIGKWILKQLLIANINFWTFPFSVISRPIISIDIHICVNNDDFNLSSMVDRDKTELCWYNAYTMWKLMFETHQFQLSLWSPWLVFSRFHQMFDLITHHLFPYEWLVIQQRSKGLFMSIRFPIMHVDENDHSTLSSNLYTL